MKTFTKAVSVILIAVMCFSLFATSAYASGETFNLNGAPSSNSGSVFNLDGAPASSNGDAFNLSSGYLDTTTFSGGSSVAQQTEPTDSGFSLGDGQTKNDTPTLSKDSGGMTLMRIAPPSGSDTSWKFEQDKTSIKISDSDADANVTITLDSTTPEDLDTDSFKRITYSTSSTGDNRQEVPAVGVEVKQGAIVLQGSWLKTLTPGQTYYFYGERSDDLPLKIAYVGINAASAADYGSFTVYGSPYTQLASTNSDLYLYTVSVGANKSFDPFIKYALIPQGASTGVYADGYIYKANNQSLAFSRTFLDGLAGGTYDIYGVTSDNQQVKFGFAIIQPFSGTYEVDRDPYVQGESDASNQFADSVTLKGDPTLSLFTNYLLIPQGSTSGVSANGYINVSSDKTVDFSRNLLDSVAAGYYDIYGITASGQQIKLTTFRIKASTVSYTVAPSTYEQFASTDTNEYKSSVSVVVNEAEKNFAQFTGYSLVPQGSTSGTSANGYVNVVNAPADGKNPYVTISRTLLDGLAAGLYDIYGIASNGQQIKFGSVRIQAGNVSYTVSPSTYEQFVSNDPNEYKSSVSVTTTGNNTFEQFNKFSIISQTTGNSRFSDGNINMSSDKKTVTFSRTLLDELEGGYYDIYGISSTGQMTKLGSVFIKAGNSAYTVNPTTYEQFVSNDPSQYADTIFVKAEGTNTFAQFTRYKFAPQGSISGTFADGSVTTANDKRSIAFSRTFLDGLNPGYYDIYGVGSDGKDVKLGTVYIMLGDLAYRVTPSTYEQYATKSTEEYKDSVSVVAPNTSTNFTQFSRYAFIPQGSGVTSYADGNVNVVNAPSGGKNPYVTFSRNFLDGLAGGYYDVYGIATNGKQVKFGSVYIKAGSGDYVVDPDVYTQYSKDAPITVTAKTADFSRFTRFAVISMGSSSGGAYADGYTSLKANKTELTFDRDFLDGLTPGYYDIYGVTSKSEQVKLGSMYIKASNGGFPDGKWDLWPDYTIPWTSGDDPLMFRSNLMALRQTYPRYTIVPRWGSGAGSIPNNMVDVNQFWDMGDGVFALGTNFLRSLPAGTYTLQVVDYKHLADCTNVVTFRIGSTLRPIDTDKHIIGSIKNLRFLCDEPVYEVYVGNIPLTYGEDYALSNGNKTITLSFEFLNKRSAGNTYTIKALTASGTYPSSTFQILSTAQGSASPRTGDESNLGLWAAFLLLSGAAVVVLVPKLRKHDF